MPQKTGASIGHAEAGAPPRVDVLIITALREEYEAVLRVGTGSAPESQWKREAGPTGLEVASRTFQAAQGGGLRVAVTLALEMGAEATAIAVSPLLKAYNPRCLAMCGVCAGRPGEVALGDVIIADVLWNYEFGKLKRERTSAGREVTRFQGRNLSYLIHPEWKQHAERFKPHLGSPWLKDRPRPYSAQMDWVLERLLHGEDPAQHPRRKERCGDYKKVKSLLREQKWVHQRQLRLTKAGKEYIEQRLADHRDGLPEPVDFQVHVGSIATGTKVIRDSGIFEKLSERDCKVLGLEMEAVAIGALAHFHRLEYMLVVKGVMDFADPAKNDNFKSFAARASAECLLAFLREHLPAGAAKPAPDTPGPGAPTEALAEYKRARAEDRSIRCLNLRGLVGIAPGQHQTELDLLDFAVAPSLHDASEEEGNREAIIRHQLSTQELEPDRRRQLEGELMARERSRWHHHGGRSPPLSFARVLHCHRRFVIIGDPGAGKSVLTRLALLACTDEDAGHRARVLLTGEDRYDPEVAEAILSLRELLPVRLTLSTVGRALTEKGLSLEECLQQELIEQRAPETLTRGLGGLLSEGRLFLLLDGLDEVPDRQRGCVADAVTALATQYPEVRLVATARPHGYFPRVSGFDYTRLAPLAEEQQQTLVSRLHRLVETRHRADEHGVEKARRRTHALMRAIRTRDEWQELSSNPLMLTLCALTSADTEDLPKHQVFLFENFMRTILEQWRSVVAPEVEDTLLEVWSDVAATLVQREQRSGVMEEYLLGLLGEALEARRAPASVDARNALRLALERGLILKNEETVVFWHSTFAEFLAARSLTVSARGAAERLLSVNNLPIKVLQFAAARLQYVLTARKEVEALVEGLLARDEEGVGRLRRTGLRAVSACMMDGVRLNPEFLQRVWSTWTELLERTPPSPLWDEFVRLTQHTPRPQLPPPLVARLARVDDLGVKEVRLGLARLVAPAAGLEPSAREACERWLEEYGEDTLKLYGAYGLALAGDWDREPVIDVLGRFSATKEIPPEAVARLVRSATPRVHESLKALVRLRLPSEEPFAPDGARPSRGSTEERDEQRLRDRRLSAAYLLAVGGQWNGDVAQVLKQTLACRPSMHREAEAKAVVRFCAREAPVQEALLDWVSDDRTLGTYAREIVGDVAALFKELPSALLKRTVNAQGKPREELESLLVSIGQERPGFIVTLRRWLGLDEKQRERAICAALILLRLVPGDASLHEALRRGMRSSDAASRASWAHLALSVRELSETALDTLQSCARSPEAVVRKLVYEGIGRWRLTHMPLDGWFACASDRGVPAASRLAAVGFLQVATQGRAQVAPLLRKLLDAEDPEVRRGALESLSWKDKLDVHVAVWAAEDAARTGNEKSFLGLIRGGFFAPEVLQAFLRALPTDQPSTASKEREEQLRTLARYFSKFVERAPACVELVLDTLEYPGPAAEFAESMLRDMLVSESSLAHRTLQKRLARAAKASSQAALRSLVALGLFDDETRPSALEASRAIDLRGLSQRELGWFASRIDDDAPEVAIPMWRLVLEGKSLGLVLKAAAKLLILCPEEAREGLQPALARVLGSTSLSDRLDAARLSLKCGFLEDASREALQECLDATGQEYKLDWDVIPALGSIHQPASIFIEEEEPVLKKLLLSWGRIDFTAMYTLCTHWPELGMQRLASWLEVEDDERFTRAVELLAERDGYREAVRVALQRRLAVARSWKLENLIALVEEYGFFSAGMVEQVLARYHAEAPSVGDIERSLIGWLKLRPELWALLLRQEPARRAMLARLLEFNVPVTRDTVLFAVEYALVHPGYWTPAEDFLRDLCKQPDEEQEQGDEEPGDAGAEQVRAWLREGLDERAIQDDFAAIHLFERLAALGSMPSQRRIVALRRALDIDLAARESEEEGRSDLLYQQAFAALQLFKLGDRDERIASILEAAVYECTALYMSSHLEFAGALLKLRPLDEPLREFLVKKTIKPFGSRSLSEELGLLEQQVGLSSTELIDVLSARLQAHTPRYPDEAPALFDALQRYGCAPERIGTLLREFVARCGPELRAHTRRALATRSELSAPDAAKLLLSVIASSRGGNRDAAQQWLARFTVQRPEDEAEELVLPHIESGYLSIRLGVVSWLMQVDEPAWLEDVLAELVAAPADTLLALYRRARAEGATLSETDWAELMTLLMIRPDDADTARLGKEWLSLGLWQAVEPATVSRLLP